MTENIEEFNKANKLYANQGRRVLGYSMYWLPFNRNGSNYVFDASLKDRPSFPLTGLTFLGLYDEGEGIIVHGEEISKYVEEDKYLSKVSPYFYKKKE